MPDSRDHLLGFGQLVGADDAPADENFRVIALAFYCHQRLQMSSWQTVYRSCSTGEAREGPMASYYAKPAQTPTFTQRN